MISTRPTGKASPCATDWPRGIGYALAVVRDHHLTVGTDGTRLSAADIAADCPSERSHLDNATMSDTGQLSANALTPGQARPLPAMASRIIARAVGGYRERSVCEGASSYLRR